MKAAFMNSIPADVWRGGEKWMVNAAAGLAQRGHDIVCIGKRNAEWLRRADARGVPTQEFSIHADLDPLLILKLFRFFRAEQTDILCCNFEKDIRTGGIAARLSGVKRVFSRKGLPLMYHKLRYRLAHQYIVDDIITPAHAIKRQFGQFGWLSPERIHVVHNGVELPDTASWDRMRLKSELNLPNSSFVVLGAGRLFSQKGFEFLLQAISLLRTKGITTCLALAGGGDAGPYEALCGELGIQDSVRFLGERNDLLELMYGADLFALSSIDEGLPNVVLEAMSVGTPVVAARAGGADEIVTDGENGYLVPLRDAGGLAEKIGCLVRDKNKRKQFSRTGLRTVREKFSMSAMNDGVESLFLSAMGTRQ